DLLLQVIFLIYLPHHNDNRMQNQIDQRSSYERTEYDITIGRVGDIEYRHKSSKCQNVFKIRNICKQLQAFFDGTDPEILAPLFHKEEHSDKEKKNTAKSID